VLLLETDTPRFGGMGRKNEAIIDSQSSVAEVAKIEVLLPGQVSDSLPSSDCRAQCPRETRG
jgi:hypothetical protein